MHSMNLLTTDVAMTNKIKRPNCIFTSAGHRHNVNQWTSEENRSWDLITAYYGQDPAIHAQLQKISDFCVHRKGSKFQNLHALFTNNPDLFVDYEYIWVMDDDLVISPAQIEEMFKVAQKYDLWVSQPAFDPSGKISHEITGFNPISTLRIVDFVEVTCPLFNSKKLHQFLSIYDGSLVGWGIDYWFSHVLQSKKSHKFAVVDTVQVYNPTDIVKGGMREIDMLQSTPERAKHSNEVLSRLNISTGIPQNIAWLITDSTIQEQKQTLAEYATQVEHLIAENNDLQTRHAALLNTISVDTNQTASVLSARNWRMATPLRQIIMLAKRLLRHIRQ